VADRHLTVTSARALALAFGFALALSSAPSSASPSAQAAPGSSVAPTVIGQVLALEDGFLVFTTGDAVRLAPGLAVPKGVRLGSAVRATLDPDSHAIVKLTLAPRVEPGDLDAAHLPREYAVAAPNSLRTAPPASEAGAGANGHGVTLTFDLRVPDSTPLGDDVYLATERTNFNPSEIRMQRVDARRFSTTLQLPAGTQLRYEFTRGTFATIERDKLGGLIVPREVTFRTDTSERDSVARWADIN
jgi:hypothetical protein